jgi:membrane protease YdiL (CAAX protease family)
MMQTNDGKNGIDGETKDPHGERTTGMQENSGARPTAGTENRSNSTEGLLAPWWHTALMVVLIVGLSVTGARQLHSAADRPLHLLPNYTITIVYEWLLGALALWGVRMRGVRGKQLLGLWKPTLRDWLADFGAAIAFWLVAVMFLSVVAQVLRHGLGSNLDPRKIADITQRLAPTTGTEMVLFLILSISAGICEEFVFRGYLQQQFARLGGHVWIGVVLAALVFGCAHGYEGIAGVLLIAAYGAMFGVLALLRRGLRTGMIAHAWHDSISGIALILLRHYGFHLGAK